jgi:hypothetical protein
VGGGGRHEATPIHALARHGCRYWDRVMGCMGSVGVAQVCEGVGAAGAPCHHPSIHQSLTVHKRDEGARVKSTGA